MTERKINSGTSCLLVKDDSLFDGWKAPIYQWFRENGFVSWGTKGVYPGVNWLYINLTSKVFAPGMPGIRITSIVGDHAITLDEFMQIYQIFKKYEGFPPLQMAPVDRIEGNKKQSVQVVKRKKLPYDDYKKEVFRHLRSTGIS